MKRSSPPEPQPPSRRQRILSGEERALWDGVAKSIKPLRKKARIEVTEPVEAAAPATAGTEKLSVRPAAPFVAKTAAPKVTVPPPLAPIGRRERAQLSKGRKSIEARLDLHGMTQARAHRALLVFLHRASVDGMTFVLVITGKGGQGRADKEGGERGVLRRQVPEWLSLPEFRNIVVGYEQAHIGHGGAGALYVRVRKRR